MAFSDAGSVIIICHRNTAVKSSPDYDFGTLIGEGKGNGAAYSKNATWKVRSTPVKVEGANHAGTHWKVQFHADQGSGPRPELSWGDSYWYFYAPHVSYVIATAITPTGLLTPPENSTNGWINAGEGVALAKQASYLKIDANQQSSQLSDDQRFLLPQNHHVLLRSDPTPQSTSNHTWLPLHSRSEGRSVATGLWGYTPHLYYATGQGRPS